MIKCLQAYGRHETTAEGILADWNKGLDFKEMGGRYFSSRDLKKGLAIDMIVCYYYDMNKEIQTVTLNRGVL